MAEKPIIEGKPFALMLVVLVLSLYLDMQWLSIFIAIVGFLMVLSSVRLPSRKPVPQGAPEKEEILTPVIVQDVGEAPYLYPPDFRLKLKPDWRANNYFEWAATAMGRGLRGFYHAFTWQPPQPKGELFK